MYKRISPASLPENSPHKKSSFAGKTACFASPRLDWLAHQKRLGMVSQAKVLVQNYMNWFLREINAKTFTDLPAMFIEAVAWQDLLKLPTAKHEASSLLSSKAKPPSPILPPGPGNAFAPNANPAPQSYVVVRIDLNCPNVPQMLLFC